MIKKPSKKVAQKPVKPAGGFELFTIENDAPLPKRGFQDKEMAKKINDLLAKIKVKQSFVIPKSNKSYVDLIVKKDYPEYRILRSAILPDKNFFRVYRLA